MGTKQDTAVGDRKVTTTNEEDANSPTPESAQTNGEKNGTNREGTVGEPVTTSFDERTAVGQPFILEDGTQDNGAIDLDKVDGAKGTSVREGNNSVREDTRQAIKDGKLPASDQPKGTLEGEEDPVRNPVK